VTSAKARFIGNIEPDYLTAEQWSHLKDKLKSYSLKYHVPEGTDGFDKTECFVEQLIAEARWAEARLAELRQALTKQEIKATFEKLITTLRGAAEQLRALPCDLEKLLEVDVNTLGCADMIEELLDKLRGVDQLIEGKAKSYPLAVKNEVSIEMAVRVLRVLQEYGIKTSATGHANFENSWSDAVRILHLIGKVIGLEWEELTWRDKIMEAQAVDEKLKVRSQRHPKK